MKVSISAQTLELAQGGYHAPGGRCHCECGEIAVWLAVVVWMERFIDEGGRRLWRKPIGVIRKAAPPGRP